MGFQAFLSSRDSVLEIQTFTVPKGKKIRQKYSSKSEIRNLRAPLGHFRDFAFIELDFQAFSSDIGNWNCSRFQKADLEMRTFHLLKSYSSIGGVHLFSGIAHCILNIL